MNILVTGQTTLHWGRMEFGNIGNYYITEPFFDELRKQYPTASIRTTLQLSDGFTKKYNIKILPMECYYKFGANNNLEEANIELVIAKKMACGNAYAREELPEYIQQIIWCDVFIDFSGDMWGENANFLGEDRFEVGLIKDRIPQILGKNTYMLAGSPGPFYDSRLKEFAKEVYKNFVAVINREEISSEILKKEGFELENTSFYPCPSFLFETDKSEIAEKILCDTGLREDKRPIIGFIMCGWNFKEGPFDKWPRDDSEYTNFVQLIKYIKKISDAKVCLLSHSNGFLIPPYEFELIHGRDYPIIKQLQFILEKEDIDIYTIDNICLPDVTKAIIGKFDMLISGRVHGAIAGFSQCVPTTIIDYGHMPKAHKLAGFARVVQQEKYIADPNNTESLIKKAQDCWNSRRIIKAELNEIIPRIKQSARKQFEIISSKNK